MNKLGVVFGLLALVVIAKAYPHDMMMQRTYQRISPADIDDLTNQHLDTDYGYPQIEPRDIPRETIPLKTIPFENQEVPNRDTGLDSEFAINELDSDIDPAAIDETVPENNDDTYSYHDVLPIKPQPNNYDLENHIKNQLFRLTYGDADDRNGYDEYHSVQIPEIDRYPRSHESAKTGPHKNMVYEESQQEYRQVLPMQGEHAAGASFVQGRTLRRAWSELV